MIPQNQYLELLAKCRSEDSKFEDLSKSLKGKSIVDKLKDDFDLLIEFKLLVHYLPPFSYAQYNDLEFSTSEMIAYNFPSASRWSNIIEYGMKIRLPYGR